METSDDKYGESCTVVSGNGSGITNNTSSPAASVPCQLEQLVQNNASFDEVTEGQFSSVEDAKTSDSYFYSANILTETALQTDFKDDIILSSSADDLETGVCWSKDEANSVPAVTIKSTVEKHADDISLLQNDFDERDVDSTACHCISKAYQIDSADVTEMDQSHLAADEQAVNSDVKLCHPRAILDGQSLLMSVGTTLHQDAQQNEQCEKEEEAASIAIRDTCQCEELKQLCRRLQVIS